MLQADWEALVFAAFTKNLLVVFCTTSLFSLHSSTIKALLKSSLFICLCNHVTDLKVCNTWTFVHIRYEF